MEDTDNKTLFLFLPDWCELDTLRRSSSPVWLWPVGNQPLLYHWMDWAVQNGFEQIEIATADRPAEIRLALDGGNYWSRPVKIRGLKESIPPAGGYREVTAPPDTESTNIPATPGELLQKWWLWNKAWLEKDHGKCTKIEQKHPSGAWVGPGVKIDPKAVITPPVWIGARSEIGALCQIGPNVIIGDRCVVDEDVTMQDSLLLSGSYAGSHIGLNQMIADGGLLLDVAKSVRVDIQEAFVLGRPQNLEPDPGFLSRLLALIFWVILAVPAWFLRGPVLIREGVLLKAGDTIDLAEGSSGPLILRRWSWLPQIIRGRFHWFGILPRTAETVTPLPSETAERIRSTRIGIFALSDAHGVHAAQHEEEWLHAAYQALAEPSEIRKMLIKSVFRLFTINPK